MEKLTTLLAVLRTKAQSDEIKGYLRTYGFWKIVLGIAGFIAVTVAGINAGLVEKANQTILSYVGMGSHSWGELIQLLTVLAQQH
jgi:uncharacterized membrane protein